MADLPRFWAVCWFWASRLQIHLEGLISWMKLKGSHS